MPLLKLLLDCGHIKKDYLQIKDFLNILVIEQENIL